MGVELRWVQKITSRKGKILLPLFLIDFNFLKLPGTEPHSNPSGILENAHPTKGKGRNLKVNDLITLKWPVTFQSFCIFRTFNTSNGFISFPVRLSKRCGLTIQKRLDENFQFTIGYITSLFSHYKKIYPQNWKTIFVHLFEKSNLLIRPDNNTGFSLREVLQTTTI